MEKFIFVIGAHGSLDENEGKLDKEIVLGYDTLKDVIAKYIC